MAIFNSKLLVITRPGISKQSPIIPSPPVAQFLLVLLTWLDLFTWLDGMKPQRKWKTNPPAPTHLA